MDTRPVRVIGGNGGWPHKRQVIFSQHKHRWFSSRQARESHRSSQKGAIMSKRLSSRWARIAGGVILAVLLVVGIVSQLIVEKNPPVLAEPVWDSPETAALVQRACADCHSNTTAWPWYTYIPPTSLLVAHDVQEGRQKLNFSEWVPGRKQDIREVGEVIRSGEMPPAVYTLMHPTAKLTSAEQVQLIDGLQKSLKQP